MDPTDDGIVVVGAGFAGLNAVRTLAHAGAPVRWIDARNYHTFQPLLYQVATAGLEPQAVVYPVRGLARRLRGVTYRMAEIVGHDPAARTLATADGARIGYGQLLIATGGAAEDFGIPGVRDHTFQLYDLEDARRLRNHMLCMLERAAVTRDPLERLALLSIVIVGAGPTGVETAGALAELRRHVVPADYPGIRPEEVRIVLVEAVDHVLGPFDPSLRERAAADLAAFGVQLRLRTAVERATADGVVLKGGERIAACTVVWAAGIRAAPVVERLGLPTGRAGRIRVEPTLQVVGHPAVFAAGDVALVQGQERLPQVAQVAIQQGVLAARNMLRQRRGESLAGFAYADRGSMATIGRSRAVADLGRVKLEGALAWWAWLVLHLVMLIGFRNRAVVLVNWAWNYLTYDRGLRAIIGAGSPPSSLSPADAEGRRSGPGTGASDGTREVAGGGFEPPTSRL